MSSIASAQIAARCPAIARPTRHGRTHGSELRYISAGARDFYNADGDYVVFTSGCGGPAATR